MSNSNLSASDMKRDHELGIVAELEEGLAELNRPQVSRFLHSDFLRVGLPILSGMLDGTFNPLRWEEFVGNQYVGLDIVDDESGEVLYALPPLMRQAPTAYNADPTRESLTSESQHLFSIRDYNPNEASAQILRVAEAAVEHQNGSLEYGTDAEARATMDTLNAIFTDNGLAKLDIPEYLKDVKADVAKEEKPVAAERKVQYDFDEGEEL